MVVAVAVAAVYYMYDTKTVPNSAAVLNFEIFFVVSESFVNNKTIKNESIANIFTIY